MSIANQLDKAMRAYRPNGITQAELSALSGVPQPTISRTLSGDSTPETKTILKLARALNISPLSLESAYETATAIDFSAAQIEPSYLIIPPDEQLLLENYRRLTKDQRHELLRRAEAVKQANDVIIAELAGKEKNGTNR